MLTLDLAHIIIAFKISFEEKAATAVNPKIKISDLNDKLIFDKLSSN